MVYSATKHIDGQGRTLGGVILGRKDMIRGPIETYEAHWWLYESVTAWVMLKGLKPLTVCVPKPQGEVSGRSFVGMKIVSRNLSKSPVA